MTIRRILNTAGCSCLGLFALGCGVNAPGDLSEGPGQWAEVLDAGDVLPGQITTGAGYLATITGEISDPSEVDLYCITITDPASFSATTAGTLPVVDTQLFLFDEHGMGITFNDDTSDGTPILSTITGKFVPAPGIYYLAVSTLNNDPIDGAGDVLWLDGPFTIERAPEGPGSANPLATWATDVGAQTGPYSITLTGADFCGEN